MSRLDSASAMKFNKWIIGLFLTFMWGLTIHGLLLKPEKGWPLLYGLLPISIVLWFWLSSFKQVSIDQGKLLIRDSRNEARIEPALVSHLREHRLNKGVACFTIVFREKTQFGRHVRIMVGTRGREFDHVADALAELTGKHSDA